MIKLILVRHGRTEWNASGRFQGQSDTVLAPEGLEQAQRLAENFPLDKITKVYSSPLNRAFTTGKYIADKFNVPIVKDDRLAEINFGDWEGLTYDQIHETWPNEIEAMFSTPSTATIPNGESFPIIQERGMKAIEEILATHQDGDVVVITAHGGILRAILAAMLHMPLEYVWNLRQDNTAVNIVVNYGDLDKYIIELINGTAHLSITKSSTPGRF